MNDKKGQWPFEDVADLSPAFDRVSVPATDPSLSGANVSDTAAAEIDNRNSQDHALEAHDQRWRVERNKLAHGPALDLEPPGIYSDPRSLQDEYAARRGQWEAEAQSIRDGFEEAHEVIRDEGVTLSDAFVDAHDDDRAPAIDFDDGFDEGHDNDGGRSM
ncbi:hypothetical protein [Pyruvatibacter mobilis]|uniref:hypothetical protein n=1 Tax=Pyruvatibacter mobilis TaxID=1712261 RepID=UPI003BAA9E73